eukprot:TRINITY_DN30768_c0_g1_i2.p1 TRINITY_DN30768_c0_g1~~TRINITY_DN30768_c0_g1_i2.p1  ORF type:complete len:208 (+),score=44.94 TRINITY_DN30768_c0_g1_i2:76-624(+)
MTLFQRSKRRGKYKGATNTHGQPHGHGIMVYGNGDVYEGEWKEGRYHGHGTYSYGRGGMFDGEWARGRKSGHGKETYATGDTYVGAFQLNERHGEGRMTYASGAYYEGSFEAGYKHGKGTLVSANGEEVNAGTFVRGRKHGTFLHTALGLKFVEKYENGRLVEVDGEPCTAKTGHAKSKKMD